MTTSNKDAAVERHLARSLKVIRARAAALVGYVDTLERCLLTMSVVVLDNAAGDVHGAREALELLASHGNSPQTRDAARKELETPWKDPR